MEIVRQVIDSSLLDKINLPESLKNRKVEITILPFDRHEEIDGKTEKHTIESLVGIFNKYAKRGIPIDEVMELESRAWAEAAVEKYERNKRNNS